MNCEYCNNMYTIETKPVNSVALDSVQYNQQFTSILPHFPFFPTVTPSIFFITTAFLFQQKSAQIAFPLLGSEEPQVLVTQDF